MRARHHRARRRCSWRWPSPGRRATGASRRLPRSTPRANLGAGAQSSRARPETTRRSRGARTVGPRPAGRGALRAHLRARQEDLRVRRVPLRGRRRARAGEPDRGRARHDRQGRAAQQVAVPARADRRGPLRRAARRPRELPGRGDRQGGPRRARRPGQAGAAAGRDRERRGRRGPGRLPRGPGHARARPPQLRAASPSCARRASPPRRSSSRPSRSSRRPRSAPEARSASSRAWAWPRRSAALASGRPGPARAARPDRRHGPRHARGAGRGGQDRGVARRPSATTPRSGCGPTSTSATSPPSAGHRRRRSSRPRSSVKAYPGEEFPGPSTWSARRWTSRRAR